MPCTPNIEPLICDNYSVGYFYTKKEDNISLSAEVYYKTIQNQIDYVDNARLTNNPYIEGEIREGKANAYGCEFSVNKSHGKLNGSASYVFSRVFYSINGITSNDNYRAPYDIPHDIKLVAAWQVLPKLNINAFWIFTTGRPATFPVGYASLNLTPNSIYPNSNLGKPATILVYAGRNSSSFPNYHRLDISVTYTPVSKKKLKHSIKAGIFNAYGRINPTAYDFNFREGDRVYVSYFYRMLPNISYGFEF